MRFLALNIGPIFQTLQHARKTRELWASSFLFSYLMEQLHTNCVNAQLEVLSPVVPVGDPERYGAGIFPDRLFAKIGADWEDDRVKKEIIDPAVKQVAKDVLPKSMTAEVEEATTFWQQYFNISFVLKDVPEADIYDALAIFLDAAELQPTYFAKEPATNYLLAFLDDPYRTKVGKNLYAPNQDGRPRKAKGAYYDLLPEFHPFPSTSDFASLELFQKNPNSYHGMRKTAQMAADTEDLEDAQALRLFYEELEKRQTDFTKNYADYHRYFCIVHADGDGLGDVNKGIKTAEAFKSFSTTFSKFQVAAADTINEFGGKPVFIGGDDLLFFAPVRSQRGTVFELLAALDSEFKKFKLSPALTLSFGVTITYYKFPLFEARQMSYDQLTQHAKHLVRGKTEDAPAKDAIAVRLLRASGSYFQAYLTKKQLEQFNETELQLRVTEEDLLTSIQYKLRNVATILELLQKAGQLNDVRLGHLLDNYFNEPVHRRYEAQLEFFKELVLNAYQTKIWLKDSTSTPIEFTDIDSAENLFALMRLLQFVTPTQTTQNAITSTYA